MNKIICDVCGTDYPETAAQCPICGCASVGAKTASGNESYDAEEQAAYSYVKGGRYSKANVRKRLKANQIPYNPTPSSEEEPEYDDEELEEVEEEVSGSNRGLVIVVIILLLAIVAVSSYIAISIFGVGSKSSDSGKKPVTIPNVTTTEPTTTEKIDVPCTALELSDVDVYLKEIGKTWTLQVTPVPEDTTDVVTFTSTDENVVIVDEFGLITAVGTGEASILVTCGEIVIDCPVLCGEKEEETTDPTDPTEPTEETDPAEPVEDFVLKLKSKDFTLSKAGATYTLYNGEVDASDITWTTDDEEVATIKDGVVTAVGKGRTRVYGEYGDQKVSCWVSCNLPEEVTEPEETEPENSTEPDVTEPEETHTYAIRINGKKPNYGTEQAAEATISIGEELNIKVVDEDGKRVEAEWTASKSGIVSIGSNSITGEKAGTVTLTVEIDGQKLTCKFIVK